MGNLCINDYSNKPDQTFKCIKCKDTISIYKNNTRKHCRIHSVGDNDICIDCQANQASSTAEECSIAWGYCNHAFHFHCISKWLRKRPNCPLDNQEWEFLKFGQ